MIEGGMKDACDILFNTPTFPSYRAAHKRILIVGKQERPSRESRNVKYDMQSSTCFSSSLIQVRSQQNWMESVLL